MLKFAPFSILLAVLLLSGCKKDPADKGQSYEEGMKIICDAPETEKEILATAPPDRRLMMLAKAIEERLKNPEAIEVFKALEAMSPLKRHDYLLEHAQEVGLESCAFATVLKLVEVH